MKRNSVNSSNIKSIGYDAATRTLEVEFNSGAVWQYEDVPATAYNDLLTAPSIGSFFTKRIKSEFKAKRVDLEEKEDA